MDVHEWYMIGKKNGWCSEIFCHTHDGIPLTDSEMDQFDDGDDPCIFAIRVNDTSEVAT